MKNIRIKIDDRIYNNLKEYCYYNKLKINKYITDCIEKSLYTDKYGDLNNIFNAERDALGKPATEKLEEKQEKLEIISENSSAENDGISVPEEFTNESQIVVKRVKRRLKRK